MKTTGSPIAPSRQRGVVLVVALLMLLVLTLIGLAATRSTALEERMTANQNDHEVAFEAAEAALRFGEGQLSAATAPSFASNTAGAYNQSTMSGTLTWQNIAWGTSATATYGGGIQPTPSTAPAYYIVQTQYTSTTPGSSKSNDQQEQVQTVYYIYAKGWGLSPNTSVILQSSFRE